MKRSLSMIVAGIVFTSVVSGALTFSMLRLLQPKNARPPVATPQALVATSPTPEIVGTENPVPVKPTPPPVNTAARRKAPNAVRASPPQSPNLVENDSEKKAESPREIVREQAEQEREKAERIRARVEGLYQGHRISEAAYKKGQADYQQALAKYENLMAKYHGATNGNGTDND